MQLDTYKGMTMMLAPETITFTVAFATLGLCNCLIALTLRGVSTHSRRTVMGALTSILVLVWLGTVLIAADRAIAPIHSDIGLLLSVSGLCALIGMAGMSDRARMPALFTCAATCAAAFILLYLPLHNFFDASNANAVLFAAIIISGTAQLVLQSQLKPHPARFTRDGLRRAALNTRGTLDIALYAALALCIALLSWRLKAFVGVNTSIHTYATIIGCATAALSAGLIAYTRHLPDRLCLMGMAIPAGALTASALGATTPDAIIFVSAILGIGVALTREALASLRVDDPSAIFASLVVPALGAWLGYGLLHAEWLAAIIEQAAFWLISGLVLGAFLYFATQFLTGLSISDRMLEEGMDAKFAAP